MSARVILIVASPSDTHARVVAGKLSASGHEVRQFDWSTAGQRVRVGYPIGRRNGSRDGWLDDAECERIDTVWYRRAPAPDLADVREQDEHRFAVAEWVCTMEGMFASLPARFVSDPARQRLATKPRQLEAAVRAGLRIPETLITNDPDAAAAFVEQHRGNVVHKVLTPTDHFFPETRRYDQHARDALLNLPVAPTMFQEEIVGPAEFRITIVGEQFFTAEIRRQPGDETVDSRLHLDRNYHTRRLPVEIERKLLAMMNDLGLLFGTVDMKVTAEGEYVFFEVNPQGQFLYVEILTDLPISDGVARFLALPASTHGHRHERGTTNQPSRLAALGNIEDTDGARSIRLGGS